MSDKKRDTIWVNVNWKLRSSVHWDTIGEIPEPVMEELWLMPLRMLQSMVMQELDHADE